VFKRYQIGRCGAPERAQHGRFREFVSATSTCSARRRWPSRPTVAPATATALANLGFSGLRVRLNSRPLLHLLVRSAGVDEALVGAAVIGIDKLDKETPETRCARSSSRRVCPAAGRRRAAGRMGGRATADAERLLADVSARTGAAGASHVAQLRQILALTPSLPSGRLVFDPFLARGMDYYTGPIFEVAADGIPFSLAGGGRFDDLVERLAA
jgi:histidyl-tRNA synthetase